MLILEELLPQHNVGAQNRKQGTMSHKAEMDLIREFICVGGEYGLAYDYIIANLEQAPFVLSSKAALALLESGLLLKYKTSLDKDRLFDLRDNAKQNKTT